MGKQELLYMAILAFVFSLCLNYTIFDQKNTTRFTIFIDRSIHLRRGMTRQSVKDYLGEPDIETETMLIWKFNRDPVEVAIDGEYYEFTAVLENGRLVGVKGVFK